MYCNLSRHSFCNGSCWGTFGGKQFCCYRWGNLVRSNQQDRSLLGRNKQLMLKWYLTFEVCRQILLLQEQPLLRTALWLIKTSSFFSLGSGKQHETMFFLFDFQFCFVYYPIFLILRKSQIKRPKVSFYLENAQKTKKQFLVSLLLITRNSLRGRR